MEKFLKIVLYTTILLVTTAFLTAVLLVYPVGFVEWLFTEVVCFTGYWYSLTNIVRILAGVKKPPRKNFTKIKNPHLN